LDFRHIFRQFDMGQAAAVGESAASNRKAVRPSYVAGCNHDFIIDEEVIHIAHHIEDAEQLGYDLEAGRRRYRREQEELKNRLHSGL
jgi:hypothetical protein